MLSWPVSQNIFPLKNFLRLPTCDSYYTQGFGKDSRGIFVKPPIKFGSNALDEAKFVKGLNQTIDVEEQRRVELRFEKFMAKREKHFFPGSGQAMQKNLDAELQIRKMDNNNNLYKFDSIHDTAVMQAELRNHVIKADASTPGDLEANWDRDCNGYVEKLTNLRKKLKKMGK
jgi:hypothetical protein